MGDLTELAFSWKKRPVVSFLFSSVRQGSIPWRTNVRHPAAGLGAAAVARKLSVLLHRLWVTGEEYQAIGYGQPTQEAA